METEMISEAEEVTRYFEKLCKYVRTEKVPLSKMLMAAMNYMKIEPSIIHLIAAIVESGKTDYPRPSERVERLVLGKKTINEFEKFLNKNGGV